MVLPSTAPETRKFCPTAADPLAFNSTTVMKYSALAWVEEKIRVPGSFSQGEIMVEAGIVRKGTDTAAVRFSNKGMSTDGWVELDTVELR